MTNIELKKVIQGMLAHVTTCKERLPDCMDCRLIGKITNWITIWQEGYKAGIERTDRKSVV